MGLLGGATLLGGSFGCLAGANPSPFAGLVRSTPSWVAVRQRFRQFHANLSLTDLQNEEGSAHHSGVRKALNTHYYGLSSETANSFLIGSWGKLTRTRPPRDIDLYFELPPDVYHRFDQNAGNKQSALLQEVKRVLQGTYPTTDLKGDGQVVVVAFNRMSVEIVPAFKLTKGQYWICDTRSGGRYKTADPKAEMGHIQSVDSQNNNNLRPLIMMIKAWQINCGVPLKSFLIELIATEFLQQCAWRLHDYFWYDWIVRDFFAFLYGRAGKTFLVPGTFEPAPLGDDWRSRAQTAYQRAVRACTHEQHNRVAEAGAEWQKIFGQLVPMTA